MAAKSAPKKNLSALKKARQDEKRNLRNRMERSKIKSIMKDVEGAAKGGGTETSEKALKDAIKAISIAKSKGILHRNNASRKISKLTKKVNAGRKSGAA